jgi:hypothetical protein
MRRSFITWSFGFGLVLGSIQSVVSQEFAIEAYSIEALGATSRGGEFTLSGSVGQVEPELMTGGEFSLVGNFWALITAVQTPGFPKLTVELTGEESIRITWPDSHDGYRLEENSTLFPGGWAPVSGTPVAVPGGFEILVAPTAGQSFFRLHKEE